MKKTFITTILIMFIALLPISWAHATESEHDTTSFIVKYKNHRHQAMLQTKHLLQLAVQHIRPLANNTYVVSLDEKELVSEAKRNGESLQDQIEQALDTLNKSPDVEYAVPNLKVYLKRNTISSAMMNVSHSDQWDEMAPPAGVDVERAWKVSQGSSDIVVAVIDSGIAEHDDLKNNILPGYSFARESVNNQDSGLESGYHGTHVAGTIAANGNILGIAPKVKILPVDVFGDREYAHLSDILDAMYWIAGEKISNVPALGYLPKVINLSLGSEGICNRAYQDAIDKVLEKNITVVIAAGNEDQNIFNETPANCRGVIAVAATNRLGKRAFYSNYGEKVTIAAPGGEAKRRGDPDAILSTIKDDYGYMMGTSMAAPHVSGIVALLYSVDPSLTPAQVKEMIVNSATPFPLGADMFSCTGYHSCGAGIANAGAAVEAASKFRAEKSNRVK